MSPPFYLFCAQIMCSIVFEWIYFGTPGLLQNRSRGGSGFVSLGLFMAQRTKISCQSKIYFTLGINPEIGNPKKFNLPPKLLINAELYGLIVAPRLEKNDTIQFGKPICNPWGQLALPTKAKRILCLDSL